MHTHIELLTDLSYNLGLIGLAEYEERQEIALWLSGSANQQSDPRSRPGDSDETPSQRETEGSEAAFRTNSPAGAGSNSSSSLEEDANRWPRFLFQNTWMFTVGDVDCYPSVPHGHLGSKTREWPKLNPYTGRVFTAVHQEQSGSRLSIGEMKLLWNDAKFIELCRKQISWYSNFSDRYDFPKARWGRNVLPRWR